MLLNEILSDKCFRMNINATNKKDIILEIANFFEKAHGLDHKVVFDALWNREQKGSTGLGKELAIPHARIPNVGSMKLAIIYSPEGKNFEAYDNLPTKLFFSAIIDEDAQPQEQLEMLKVIVETCEKTDLMDALGRIHTANALKDTIVRRITEIQNH
ncbi:MAG: PTS sugar transporter subunit IIA [Brevinema sp.]